MVFDQNASIAKFSIYAIDLHLSGDGFSIAIKVIIATIDYAQEFFSITPSREKRYRSPSIMTLPVASMPAS